METGRMTRITAVLFDLDNTLYDRDASFLRWARWFARDRLGLDADPAHGAAVDRLVTMDASGYRPRAEVFRWVKEQHPALTADVDDLIAGFYEEHVAHLALDGETRGLLDALDAAGLPFGIVTNGSAQQLLKVRTLGLDARTTCVHVSALVGCRKPEAAIFLAAAADLGVAPGAILFVGDNPEADIVGAAAVGMRTAWLRRGRAWPDHLAATTPHYVIDSLAELRWVAEAPRPVGGDA